MAFGFFKKKGDDKSAGGPAPGDGAASTGDKGAGNGASGNPPTANGAPGGAPGGDPSRRNLAKAQAFYRHARGVTDHDYAIDCYTDGLRHDPDNMEVREELREVALRRKVAGGKPPGIGEKMKSGGKDPIERLIYTEWLWAKDPLNKAMALSVMERAVEADKTDAQLHMREVAYWVGEHLLKNQASKPLSKADYLLICDLFAKIERYDRAMDAAKNALALDPEDSKVLQLLKDMEAELTMWNATHTADGEEKKTSLGNVTDLEKQRQLDDMDNLGRGEEASDRLITSLRADLAKKPDDPVVQGKLIDVLLQRESPKTEAEAVQMLQALFEKTGEFRHKARIGDVKMKQYARQVRALREQIKVSPNNAALRKEYESLELERAKFELHEYDERVKAYPTDMALRFELGKRLRLFKRYDEAINSFQLAKASPALRVQALYHLGQCFRAQGWYEEAAASFNEAKELHEIPSDQLGLDLRYWLMDSQETTAIKTRNVTAAKIALQLGSEIIRHKFDHRDTRQRMEGIRKLITQLESGGAAGAA